MHHTYRVHVYRPTGRRRMNQDSSSWPSIVLARNTGCRWQSARRKPYKQQCVRPLCDGINLTIHHHHHHHHQRNKGSRLRQLRTPLNCRQRGPRETSAKCRASNHLTPKQIPLILDVVTSRPWSTRIAIVCAGARRSSVTQTGGPEKRATARGTRHCFGLPTRPLGSPMRTATPDIVAGRMTGAHPVSCTVHRGMNERVDPTRLRGTSPSPSNPAAV